MIVVWKPRDNITVKESSKKQEISVSPLELEIFIRSLRIVVRRSAFLQERSPTREELEASWEAHTRVNNQFGIMRGLEWARPKNVLEAMVERRKVKKKLCPTILKYNLLIYLVWV